MTFSNKKDTVFLILAGFFITNAIVAELIGGKLIEFFGTFTQSIGIVLWPVVFIITDLVNEYYGQNAVRKLSYITVGLIGFTFLILFVCMSIPAVGFSPVSDENFRTVFGQSQYIIIGSICAFVVSQLVDSSVFWMLRNKTGKKMIWLRATGSTIVSQLVDTFIVQFIAFVIPGVWTMDMFLKNASYGYVFKLLVALAIIPIIYLVHFLIDKYLGDEVSNDMIKHNAEINLHHKVED
ncbi:MAG: queuosine precursor transporter [Bacteroidetes bacterium]|nr:queuosine precursor transporter [Bacteroidota bacterium]